MRGVMSLRLGGLGLCVCISLSCAADGSDAAAGDLPLLRLEARDFTFSGPQRAPGGLTRVRLVNHGPSWHEALVTRLPDGVTAEEYLSEARAGKAFPVAAVDIGGPGKVATGDSSEVVLDLEPGLYAIVCWADNHVKAGMLSAVVITVDDSSKTAREEITTKSAEQVTQRPTPTGEVRLEDFKITHDSATYLAGANVLRIRNTGQRPHDLTFYRLAEGKTVRDFGVWHATREGPAPAVPVGGIVTLAPGREGVATLNLPPGRYFAGCGTPEEDPNGVTLHIQMGMLDVFEIK